MPAAIVLRDDYDAGKLRALARRCRDAKQSRRLLSIAAVYDGMSRSEAAKVGGMDRQVLRDWVLRFNTEGPEGLVDRKPPGARRRLSDEQLTDLSSIIEAGPQDGLVRWRCCDLQALIEERYGVCYKQRAVGYLLKQLGFSRISGRPQHPKQDARVIEAFKKTSPLSC
ncbi:MAG: helix-turn-helix domain-containing protein [Burkholderiales bacterium]|nr:helix-turn-helix domain-containing protein [Burkholderiales bacterium]